MLWYLRDVEQGGETWFPRSFGLPHPEDIKACNKGLRVSPKARNAILTVAIRVHAVLRSLNCTRMHRGIVVDDGDLPFAYGRVLRNGSGIVDQVEDIVLFGH